jgi:hypothetical protein
VSLALLTASSQHAAALAQLAVKEMSELVAMTLALLQTSNLAQSLDDTLVMLLIDGFYTLHVVTFSLCCM